MNGGQRPADQAGVKVGIHAQHIDPLVGPDLMLSNINKDLTISRAIGRGIRTLPVASTAS